jgi:hypothetical protein
MFCPFNVRSEPPHSQGEVKPLGSVFILYVKSVSEKFRHIENQYNIRTISELNTILGVHS